MSQILDIWCDGGCYNNQMKDKDKADAYGSFLFEGREIVRLKFPDLNTNNQAEYMILIKVLEELYTRDTHNIRANIHMDSELVIKQLTNGWKVKSENLFNLYSRAKYLLGNLPGVKLHKISGKQMKIILGH